MSYKRINSREFAKLYALRPELRALFFGAGTSASAGIPTGYMMTRDLKTVVFCNKTGISRSDVDSADPLWSKRIDQYFLTNSLLPPNGDPQEYSAAFELVYPDEAHRRQYIADSCKRGTPSFGHRLFAALVTSSKTPCILTTNFDSLIETAIAQTDQLVGERDRSHPTVAAIDSADRASRCLRESDWPLIAKLHGDYQSVSIKNTSKELRHQDETMRKVLAGVCARFGLVVVGYSGRDESVMDALEMALLQDDSFPGDLFWVSKSGQPLLPRVEDLLQKAVQNAVTAYEVVSHSFDELASDIFLNVELPQQLKNHVDNDESGPRLIPVQVNVEEALSYPVLRCSALRISDLPDRATNISLAEYSGPDQVRELLKNSRVRATVAVRGNEVLAFGPTESIIEALTPLGASTNGTTEINPSADSLHLGLIYDALIRALCRRRPIVPRLRSKGHSILVETGRPGEKPEWTKNRNRRLSNLKKAYRGALSGSLPGSGLPYREGLRITMIEIGDDWWCVFEPHTFVEMPRPKRSEIEKDHLKAPPQIDNRLRDQSKEWTRERWARRYNRDWSNIIAEWAGLLSETENGILRACGISDSSGQDALFEISDVTAWSRPAHKHPYFFESH